MHFQIDEETGMILKTVRRFREAELRPLESEFLQKGKLSLENRLKLEQKGRELGLWALDVPEEYGGSGLNELTMCMITKEIWKSPVMFEFGGMIEPSLYYCNNQQKEKYFYPVLNGEKRSCYAFTEPNAGSDLAGLKTSATKKGNNWVLNGYKTFISKVDRADFCIVFASTDPKLGAKGISVFLVDKDTPGFSIVRSIETMGDDWEPYELSFEDCEIPEENLLGELNNGWEIANYQLTHGRLRIAAKCLAIAEHSIELALKWAKERTTFGKPIGERQGIQWMLADSEVQIQASELLIQKAAWLYDQKKNIRNEAFVAKLFASEAAQDVTDRAVQIFGGTGYTKDVAVQSYYRQARVWRIGHGTTEIHRWMIARNMLKE
jgi:acyl-CoA dehydrogenase